MQSRGTGNVVLTVRRNRGTGGRGERDYINDLSAVAGSDYTTASGTLAWAAGDMSDRSITIAVTNDTAEEIAESFRVTLANAAGGRDDRGSSGVHVEIQANDAAVAPPPPGGGGAAARWRQTSAAARALASCGAGAAEARRRAHDRRSGAIAAPRHS
jgi:hypothetical protein